MKVTPLILLDNLIWVHEVLNLRRHRTRVVSRGMNKLIDPFHVTTLSIPSNQDTNVVLLASKSIVNMGTEVLPHILNSWSMSEPWVITRINPVTFTSFTKELGRWWWSAVGVVE